jgi:hypothetical protein
MWSRILRLFSTGVLAYSNPVKFVLGLIMIVVAPYLIYLLWGSVIFFVLLAISGWALYRFF